MVQVNTHTSNDEVVLNHLQHESYKSLSDTFQVISNRKKQTNTIYTINAINKLIELKNNESELDKKNHFTKVKDNLSGEENSYK